MIRAYFEMLLIEADAGASTDKSPFAGKETAGKMKQFATWFTHGVPGGAKLRAAIYQARTGADVLAQVELFFAARAAEDALIEPDSEGVAQAFPEAALVCD
jgi:hypothetical protein